MIRKILIFLAFSFFLLACSDSEDLAETDTGTGTETDVGQDVAVDQESGDISDESVEDTEADSEDLSDVVDCEATCGRGADCDFDASIPACIEDCEQAIMSTAGRDAWFTCQSCFAGAVTCEDLQACTIETDEGSASCATIWLN